MRQRNHYAVVIVMSVFFVISFLTNILNTLVPDIIQGFGLSLTMAGLLPFSFFIAYGVMSIPAGVMVERRAERVVMAAAFVLAFLGSAAFALLHRYSMAISSLFVIGAGMAVLQVAINPLLRVAGGEEHFAFYSVCGQFVFGLASFMSPHVYSSLVQGLTSGSDDRFVIQVLGRIVPPSLPWISMYWIFAVVTLVMIVVIATSRLPKVELKEDERAGAVTTYVALLRRKVVWLYFFGIFAYVGSEQGIGNWMSEFLRRYHGFDPATTGATVVSGFWGLMTVGCLLGLVLLKLLDSRVVLRWFAFASLASLAAALFGPSRMAMIAFPALGFFLSVMWSIIFSLALNSLKAHHGAFSGILCTGIIGGAIVPFVIGWLGDLVGLRVGMLFLYVTLGYVLSVSVWAQPLIGNETIWDKRRSRDAAS